MAKFLGFGVVGVEIVFLSLLARSLVPLLEEEEEEELEEEGELVLFFMLLSLAFMDSLSTLAVCVEKSPVVESEEELPITIG
jgi:hypothetical protein